MTLNLNHPWPPLVLSWLILIMLLCSGCAAEYHKREYRGTWWCIGICGRVVKDNSEGANAKVAPDPFEVDITSSQGQPSEPLSEPPP